MSKIKVLHLIETLGSGGAERLLHTNLKHFDTNEIDSRVVTVFERNSYWQRDIEAIGIDVKTLGCSGYRDIIKGTLRLRKMFAEDRPDLIHTHLWTANVIGRLTGIFEGIPVVSSIHSPEYEPEAFRVFGRSSSRKMWMAMHLDKLTARHGCRRMIAVSKYVREVTHNALGFPFEKIDVIYNPIDLESSQNDSNTGEQFRSRPDSLKLLTIGRLSPEKGIIYAILAMPEILKVAPDAKLICIGSKSNTNYTAELKAAVEDFGLEDQVHLIGERTNIAEYLEAADLFLFPSLFEGLGIALVEAMGSGKVCIASGIRPLDEFVQDGHNGVLVPPCDSKAIASAVIDLLSDSVKCEELGQNSRETVDKLFQPGPAARRLGEIYRKTVQGK